MTATILENLQKQLESTKALKQRYEERAERFAIGSASRRELEAAVKYAKGVIKGLEIAIEAIRG